MVVFDESAQPDTTETTAVSEMAHRNTRTSIATCAMALHFEGASGCGPTYPRLAASIVTCAMATQTVACGRSLALPVVAAVRADLLVTRHFTAFWWLRLVLESGSTLVPPKTQLSHSSGWDDSVSGGLIV